MNPSLVRDALIIGAFAVALFLIALLGLEGCVRCDGDDLAGAKRCPNAVVEFPPSPEGACAHLAELGCPEARNEAGAPSCATDLRRANRIADMKLACITSAPNVAAVRACGSVRCRD